MRSRRIRSVIRRYLTRRRFARILRAYGYVPTKQLIDMSMDFEGDDGARVVVREGWRP